MGIGLSGLRGIGGISGGGMRMTPQYSSPMSAPATSRPTTPMRGMSQPQGEGGALSTVGQGIGYANMANKALNMAGVGTGAAGGALGAVGGALGTAGSLSRVMSGNGTPMDYAGLAKAGYSAATSGGSGAGAAGMGAWALPAAVVLAGVMGWNEPGMSNEQVVSQLVNSQGGAKGFVNTANREISALDPSHYKDLVAKSIENYNNSMRTVGEGQSPPTPQPIENVIQQIQSGVLGAGYPGGKSVLENAMLSKFDPAILDSYLGKGTADDLRNRFTTARQNAYDASKSMIADALKSKPLEPAYGSAEYWANMYGPGYDYNQGG